VQRFGLDAAADVAGFADLPGAGISSPADRNCGDSGRDGQGDE